MNCNFVAIHPAIQQHPEIYHDGLGLPLMGDFHHRMHIASGGEVAF